MESKKPLYLDSGVLVNLYASGHMDEILQALPYQCFIMDNLQQKTLLLWPVEEGEPGQIPQQRASVQFSPLIERGLLGVAAFDILRHCDAFVAFAVSLPDAQAKMLALALEKNAAIATDDKFIQHVVRSIAPEVAIQTTLHLLQQWETHQIIPSEVMRAVARKIRQQACFIPEVDEPCHEWWSQLL